MRFAISSSRWASFSKTRKTVYDGAGSDGRNHGFHRRHRSTRIIRNNLSKSAVTFAEILFFRFRDDVRDKTARPHTLPQKSLRGLTLLHPLPDDPANSLESER